MLFSKDDKKKIIFGPVFIPSIVDTDNECITKEEIAYAFGNFSSNSLVIRGKKYPSRLCLDTSHDGVINGCEILESGLLAKSDGYLLPGTWTVTIKVPDSLWEKIECGELNSLSPHGSGDKKYVDANVTMITKAEGSTNISYNAPEHAHGVFISFSVRNDQVVPFYTDEVLGHRHLVIKTCATNNSFGHSHRLPFITEGSYRVEKSNMTRNIKLLSKVNPTFISLVRHGANRAPFTLLAQGV